MVQEQKICLEHSGVCKAVEDIEKDNSEQWKAIDGIRAELKKAQVNIALLMGGIAVVQFLAVMFFK